MKPTVAQYEGYLQLIHKQWQMYLGNVQLE